MHWIGDVLTRVSVTCIDSGEPLLSALCVDSRGRVGAGYTVVVEDHRREPLHPPRRARRPRTAAVPPVLRRGRARGRGRPGDAGRGPADPDPVAPSRGGRAPAYPKPAAAPAAVPAEPALMTCPVHFTVLPATGVCDLCD